MSKMHLIKNNLYINITNNKDNITVLQYLYDEPVGKHTFSVFRDIVTGEECTSLSAKTAYTEKKFKTLSKLSFDEAMELFYSREFPYQYEFDKEGDKGKDATYIPPMENFKIYSEKAREVIIELGLEEDYYITK